MINFYGYTDSAKYLESIGWVESSDRGLWINDSTKEEVEVEWVLEIIQLAEREFKLQNKNKVLVD